MLHDVDREDEVISPWADKSRQVGLLEVNPVPHPELHEEFVAIGDLLGLDVNPGHAVALVYHGEPVGVLAEAAAGIENVGWEVAPVGVPLPEGAANVPRAEQKEVEQLIENDTQPRGLVEKRPECALDGVVVHGERG